MYRWAVSKFVRFAYAKAIAGETSLLIRGTTPDVSFSFPGTSSFSASLTGRDALREWLSRFTALQPTFQIEDVVVSGAPWNMRVALRFRDSIGEDYRNDGVEWLDVRWGRVSSIEVFLDTERVERWDRGQTKAATLTA